MSSQVTRRTFVAGALAGTALSASATAAFAADSVAPDKVPAWDAEYDVVVVGYGAAGANAAINAADAGAKVLLVEKCAQGEEGGNSKYSGQGLQCFEDKEQALTYYKSLRGFWNTPSDAVIQAYADHIEDMREYLISLGADPENLDNYRGSGEPWRSKGEFPELEGAGHMLYYCVSGNSFDGPTTSCSKTTWPSAPTPSTCGSRPRAGTWCKMPRLRRSWASRWSARAPRPL